jgi:hypothetical protein
MSNGRAALDSCGTHMQDMGLALASAVQSHHFF